MDQASGGCVTDLTLQRVLSSLKGVAAAWDDRYWFSSLYLILVLRRRRSSSLGRRRADCAWCIRLSIEAVPYFLVGIRGDRARAAGLLAQAGIQNVLDAPVDGDLAAQLSAESAEVAIERVRTALASEPGFTVEDGQLEQL
jgi:hypothetical protein